MKTLGQVLAEQPLENVKKNLSTALCIIELLRSRAKIDKVFKKMTIEDLDQLVSEIQLVIQHGGKPPSWI